jgi:hypothetical protein
VEPAFATLGLDPGIPPAELNVDSIRPARRIGPDGQAILEMIVEITQRLPVYLGDKPPSHQKDATVRHKGPGFVLLDQFVRDPSNPELDADFWFRGGCTLVVNLNLGSTAVPLARYAIVKRVTDMRRLERQVLHAGKSRASLRATYFGAVQRIEESEAFAMLHRGDPGDLADLAVSADGEQPGEADHG